MEWIAMVAEEPIYIWGCLIFIIAVLMAVLSEILTRASAKKTQNVWGKREGMAALTAFRTVLDTAAVVFAMVMTVLLCNMLICADTSAKTSSGSVEKVLTDRYDMFITNEVSDALEGVMSIEKVYWLNDDDLIAPRPNQSCYGSSDDPATLQWLLDKAGEMLDVEEFVFDTNATLQYGSKIHYYLDETLFAITWRQFEDNCVYTYAEVKIAHPSQFRRFLAGGTYGSDKQFTTTQMAGDVNAVLASAGDFYKYRVFGTIVHDGVVKRINSNYLDTCFIDDKGDLILSYRGEITTMEAAQAFVDEHNIRFSIAFGPILVDNGVRCEPYNYFMGEVNDPYPRAALCQMGELHYLVVTAGREEGIEYHSVPNIHEFAAYLARTGCQKAYALDGGQTATIAMNGQMMNPAQYGSQRLISDIFYFATALPDGE